MGEEDRGERWITGSCGLECLTTFRGEGGGGRQSQSQSRSEMPLDFALLVLSLMSLDFMSGRQNLTWDTSRMVACN